MTPTPTIKDLDETVTLLIAKVDALHAGREGDGWGESAKMVLAEIKRQGMVLDRHDAQLQGIREDIANRMGAIQLALVSAQNDTHRVISKCEQRITAVEQRCVERATKHDDAASQRRDIWEEINKLRAWVKQVNDAGLVDQTRGVVHWPIIWIVSALGAISGMGIGYVFLRFVGAS